MINQIIILFILICINAFFAATEIAFISINDIKFKDRAKKGDKKAKKVLELLKTPSAFLATIQIGITLAGFLSSAFASEAFSEKLAPFLYDVFPNIELSTWNTLSIIVITILLSLFMLLFGELIPKRIAMKHDEKIAYNTVSIIKFIFLVTKPIVLLLTNITNKVSKSFGVNEYEEERITEEEIRMIISEGSERGAIKKYEQNLINNVLEFNDITAEEIMLEKKYVYSLNTSLTISQTLEIIKKEGYKYNRVPLYDEDKDNIVGILYLKDLLKNINNENITLQTLMHEVLQVTTKDYINYVFSKMKRNKKQFAIVTSNKEYVGIVTMEDVLEQIVGEIKDEYGM